MQRSGERCSRLLSSCVLKLLQGIFNLRVGGGEGTVHSQRLKRFYPLQFSDTQLIWGRKQLTVIEQPWMPPRGASLFPKAPGSTVTVTFQKVQLYLFIRACNTMDCPTSVTAFCFAVILPEMTS